MNVFAVKGFFLELKSLLVLLVPVSSPCGPLWTESLCHLCSHLFCSGISWSGSPEPSLHGEGNFIITLALSRTSTICLHLSWTGFWGGIVRNRRGRKHSRHQSRDSTAALGSSHGWEDIFPQTVGRSVGLDAYWLKELWPMESPGCFWRTTVMERTHRGPGGKYGNGAADRNCYLLIATS